MPSHLVSGTYRPSVLCNSPLPWQEADYEQAEQRRKYADYRVVRYETSANTLKRLAIGALGIGLFSLLIAFAQHGDAQSLRDGARFARVMYWIAFITAPLALLSSVVLFVLSLVQGDYPKWRKERSVASKKTRQLKDAHANRVVDTLRQLAESRDLTGRVIWQGSSNAIVYCKLFVAFLNIEQDWCFFLRVKDCRDIKHQSREAGRSISTQHQGTSGKALEGAVLATIFLGEDMSAAGAIVGAAGPSQSYSTESVHYEDAVFIYTRLDDKPIVQVEFLKDSSTGHEFYAVIANGIEELRDKQ